MKDLYNKLVECLEDPARFMDHMTVITTVNFGILYDSCTNILYGRKESEKANAIVGNYKVQQMCEHFEEELGEKWKEIEEAVDILCDHIHNGTQPPSTYKDTKWSELENEQIILGLKEMESPEIADLHLTREFLHSFIPTGPELNTLNILINGPKEDQSAPKVLGEMEQEMSLRQKRVIIAEGLKANPEEYETFNTLQYLLEEKSKQLINNEYE